MNGVNPVFTLANAYQPGMSRLFLNGLRLSPTDDYTETSSTQIALVEGPTWETRAGASHRLS